jgi:STE24 endopeptidase
MQHQLSLLPRLLGAFILMLLTCLSVTQAYAADISQNIPIPTVALAQAFDANAATQAYLDTVPKSERAKTDQYFEGGYWIRLWGALLGTAMAALLMLSGASVKMRNVAQRVTRFKFIHTLIYGALFILLTWLLSLPFTLYTDYFREHQYGLSNLSFAAWISETLTDFVVSLLFGSLAIAVIYAVIRKAPNTWWIWGAVVGIVMTSVLILLSPVFIAPLFNEYTPVSKPEVREAVLALARANGVPAKEVYEFNASKQTKRISANVSGFAGTMRISLNDNLLLRTTLPETRMVMAHEIGHYVLNHMYKMLVMLGVITVAMFAFAKWVFSWVAANHGSRTGVRDVSDVAGLPILVAAITVFSLLMTPINNTIIRIQEAEADLFGLNASREPDGFALTALKLGEYRKLDPTPLEEYVFFDHPSGRSRISMAMKWKAEQLKQTK